MANKCFKVSFEIEGLEIDDNVRLNKTNLKKVIMGTLDITSSSYWAIEI